MSKKFAAWKPASLSLSRAELEPTGGFGRDVLEIEVENVDGKVAKATVNVRIKRDGTPEIVVSHERVKDGVIGASVRKSVNPRYRDRRV